MQHSEKLINFAGGFEPDLVDTKTAAKILSLRNHHTLEVWRSTGHFPSLQYYRVGRAVRYRRTDLEAFLNANLVGEATGSVGARP